MSTSGSIVVLSSSGLDNTTPVTEVTTQYYRRLLGRPPGPAEANVTMKTFFESSDPPPTEMTVDVDTRFLELAVSNFNNDVHVFLTKYILDCVWRDAENPSASLTANSGTSVSKFVKVYLYAGDPSAAATVRLINAPLFLDGSGDEPDFYVYRDQTVVVEKAHNPYHPSRDLSSDLYFENQFTQQSQAYYELNPGMYLGRVHPQAISALRLSRKMTVRWESNRASETPSHPSPFWYSRFLRGSSLWNFDTRRFDIQEPGTVSIARYKRLSNVHVIGSGGPYFPLTLYTFAEPQTAAVAPFINDSTLANVADPLDGEVHPLNHGDVTLHLSQVAIAGNTSLSNIVAQTLPMLAPSDADRFAVPTFDGTTGNALTLTVYGTTEQTVCPPRYLVDAQPSLHFPNGAWRGQALASVNTQAGAAWKSPFVWEQSLTATQLAILNETAAYPISSTAHRYEILNTSQHLFMDPGSTWNEQTRVASSGGGGSVQDVTVGERSLQFDFGVNRSFFVNKCQLIFPRSQEDHQPYRIQASVQKEFQDADSVVATRRQSLWLGGVQFHAPSGSRSNPEEYRYLNTHSQSAPGLDGTYTQWWDVDVGARSVGGTFASPSDVPIRVLTENDFEPLGSARARGRSRVVKSPGAPWCNGVDPENPAIDTLRQEFGPFARGATIGDLKDARLCKAWSDTTTADTDPTSTDTCFFDLGQYLASPQGRAKLGYTLFVRQTGDGWTPSAETSGVWLDVSASRTGDAFVAVGQGVVTTYASATRQWTARSGLNPSIAWVGVASSANGDSVMACANAVSQLHRSEDRGVTWSAVSSSPSVAWSDVVMSEDGRIALGVALNDYVYRYTSLLGSGQLSQAYQRPANEPFVAVAYASQADVAVAVTRNDLYLSSNKGLVGTWSKVNMGAAWYDVGFLSTVDVSSDGNRIVVSSDDYTSVVEGVRVGGTWTFQMLRYANGNEFLNYIARVAYIGTSIRAITTTGLHFQYDGSTWTNLGRIELGSSGRVHLSASRTNPVVVIAAINNRAVHLSYNGGSTWVMQTALPISALWTAVAITPDGSRVAAVAADGHVYTGTVSGVSVAWTRRDGAGIRGWSSVAVSPSGQYMYAGTTAGFLYGSADQGQTWQRDISPIVGVETWNSMALKNDIGIVTVANTTSPRLFTIALGSPGLYPEAVVGQYMDTPRPWKSIDCAADAQVAVAVEDGGNVHVTRDGGSTWTNQGMGNRSWTCVAVSADGTQAIAMAADGSVAIGVTTTGGVQLSSWSTSNPLPSKVWTDVDCADDFSKLVATAHGQGMFVSTDGGSTWTADNNLLSSGAIARPWACVALSGDGNFATAGAQLPASSLYVYNTGSAWYQFANTSLQRALVLGDAPKLVINNITPSPPDLLLDADLPALSTNIQGPFANNVYDYVSTRHHVYRVDCARRDQPTSEVLLSQDTRKVYGRPNGNLVFSTDSPSAYILDTYVGSTNVVVAQAVGGGTYQLVHPWNTQRQAKQDLVVNASYMKFIVPSALALSTQTFVIDDSAQNNHQLHLQWNGTSQTVTIPNGTYTISTLNQELQDGLESLNLYLTETSTGTKKFFVRFVDTPLGLRLEVDAVPRGSLTGTGYTSPTTIGPWPYAPAAAGPSLVIDTTNNTGTTLGFDPGVYPTESETPSVGGTYVKYADFVPPAWTITNLGTAIATFVHSYEIYPDMYEAVGTLEPMLDYIVKESYYFAPGYDQYNTKSVGTANTFQPRFSETAQKMVNASLASTRYFGVAFGSFLFEALGGVYTRGKGNAMKLYSLRPVTQLFSFDMGHGFLKDKTGTATTTATFVNHVQKGNLYAAMVAAQGQKYTDRDTTVAFLQPTLDEAETGYYYDEATGAFADTTMFLLGTATANIVQTSLGPTTTAQRAKHAAISFDMEDDPTSANLEVIEASSKTALRRSAEFHLLFKRNVTF